MQVGYAEPSERPNAGMRVRQQLPRDSEGSECSAMRPVHRRILPVRHQVSTSRTHHGYDDDSTAMMDGHQSTHALHQPLMQLHTSASNTNGGCHRTQLPQVELHPSVAALPAFDLGRSKNVRRRGNASIPWHERGFPRTSQVARPRAISFPISLHLLDAFRNLEIGFPLTEAHGCMAKRIARGPPPGHVRQQSVYAILRLEKAPHV